MNAQDDYITVAEARQILQLGKRMLYRYGEAGRIRTQKVGRRLLFNRADTEALASELSSERPGSAAGNGVLTVAADDQAPSRPVGPASVAAAPAQPGAPATRPEAAGLLLQHTPQHAVPEVPARVPGLEAALAAGLEAREERAGSGLDEPVAVEQAKPQRDQVDAGAAAVNSSTALAQDQAPSEQKLQEPGIAPDPQGVLLAQLAAAQQQIIQLEAELARERARVELYRRRQRSAKSLASARAPELVEEHAQQHSRPAPGSRSGLEPGLLARELSSSPSSGSWRRFFPEDNPLQQPSDLDRDLQVRRRPLPWRRFFPEDDSAEHAPEPELTLRSLLVVLVLLLIGMAAVGLLFSI